MPVPKAPAQMMTFRACSRCSPSLVGLYARSQFGQWNTPCTQSPVMWCRWSHILVWATIWQSLYLQGKCSSTSG